MIHESGVLLFFGGPAGAGKSTLAVAWCETRARALHIELDRLRELIVAGRADPQQPSALAGEQYVLSAAASLMTARLFLAAGYDVAIDDVFDPNAFATHWYPNVRKLNWRIAIVRPSLEKTLRRSALRDKRVLAEHSRSQHAATVEWPEQLCIDTTNQTVAESLALVQAALERW